MWVESDLPEMPHRLDGHTVTYINGKILVFGGSTLCQSSGSLKSSSSLLELDVNTKIWREIIPKQSSSAGPMARTWHSASRVGNNLYIFGGRNSDLKYFNDLWVFNLSTLSWSKCDTQGSPPSKRAAHSAFVVHDRFIYVFGGRYKNLHKVVTSTGLTHTHYSDLYCFDTETMIWSLVKCSGQGPSPRSSTISQLYQTEDKEPRLVVIGGYTCTNQYFQYFDDGYEFDINSNVWKKLYNEKLPSMTSTTSTLYNNSLYVFGGEGVTPYGNKTMYSHYIFKINFDL